TRGWVFLNFQSLLQKYIITYCSHPKDWMIIARGKANTCNTYKCKGELGLKQSYNSFSINLAFPRISIHT
ncbi:hypothetical protein VIGAN_02284000, partial [Vigna angularis var. angularis]